MLSGQAFRWIFDAVGSELPSAPSLPVSVADRSRVAVKVTDLSRLHRGLIDRARPAPVPSTRSLMRIDNISGKDDLHYEVEVRDAAGAPVTSGTILMQLCAYGTTTLLVESDVASVPLVHQGAGLWTGQHDDAAVSAAITSVPIGGLFDRVLVVGDRGARRVARCRRVSVVDA